MTQFWIRWADSYEDSAGHEGHTSVRDEAGSGASTRCFPPFSCLAPSHSIFFLDEVSLPVSQLFRGIHGLILGSLANPFSTPSGVFDSDRFRTAVEDLIERSSPTLPFDAQ